LKSLVNQTTNLNLNRKMSYTAFSAPMSLISMDQSTSDQTQIELDFRLDDQFLNSMIFNELDNNLFSAFYEDKNHSNNSTFSDMSDFIANQSYNDLLNPMDTPTLSECSTALNDLDFVDQLIILDGQDPILDFDLIDELCNQSNENSNSSFDFSDESLSVMPSISDSPSSNSPHKRLKTSSGSIGKNKKESNKAAANRYRSKKQKEKDDLFTECQLYELKNVDLKKEIEDVQSEINCIKNLLVEALITKSSK